LGFKLSGTCLHGRKIDDSSTKGLIRTPLTFFGEEVTA